MSQRLQPNRNKAGMLAVLAVENFFGVYTPGYWIWHEWKHERR
jgi:hypothetical protein